MKKHWEMELEKIVVPGNNLEEAITNAISHLSDESIEGNFPNVIGARLMSEEEVNSDCGGLMEDFFKTATNYYGKKAKTN